MSPSTTHNSHAQLSSPRRDTVGSDAKRDKKERLAKALRENLQRRKIAAREQDGA